MKRPTITVLSVLLLSSVAVNIWQYKHSLSVDDPKPQAKLTPNNSAHPETSSKTASSTESLTISELAVSWFLEYRFDEAYKVYELIENTDIKAAEQLKAQLLVAVENKLANGDSEYTRSALDYWLEQNAYDEDFLELKAKFFIAQNRIAQAVDIYFELTTLTTSETRLQSYRKSIEQQAEHYIAELVTQKNWLDAIAFLDQLIWQEPDNIEHLLTLAKIYIAAEDNESARIPLETASHFPEYELEAHNLLALITPKEPEPIKTNRQLARSEIQLQPLNNHFLVPLTINRNSRVSLLIDTGASLTVLSRHSFNRLNIANRVTFLSTAQMNTAGGIANADIYQVDKLTVGNFSVADAQIAVMDLGDLGGSDGLLGMNFLGQFNFQIDTEDHILSLRQK
ncbi:aspartyl protease family protein [Sessilibacter sp. MAH4]